MPWTESRTREEWLVEVRRRGERIRRRRRVALSVVGALAMVLPVSALVSMTGGDPDPNLRVTAVGPGPGQGSTAAGALLPIVTTTSLEAEIAHVPSTGSAAAAEPGSVPSAEASPPTTAEVHRRAGAVNGRAPYDDPVVRPTPTTTLGEGGSTGNSSSGPTLAAPSAPPPTTDPALTTCPVSEVEVVVTVERSNYASGETVQWTSTLTNRSATTCLVSGRAFFHVEDVNGKIVGSFPSTADFQLPVKAEPGKTFQSGRSWDQTDCSANPCALVPAGRYTVVASWTEAAPYVGRGSFQIGG
ncbi:MAG TPA: hypothetical protein VHF91_00820 [Acidimicrobiales bacterium]|nr:hypothetical protein [Acidimicrobiales bacterium]